MSWLHLMRVKIQQNTKLEEIGGDGGASERILILSCTITGQYCHEPETLSLTSFTAAAVAMLSLFPEEVSFNPQLSEHLKFRRDCRVVDAPRLYELGRRGLGGCRRWALASFHSGIGQVCTRKDLQKSRLTQGHIYTRTHLHKERFTQGHIWTRRNLHMNKFTHGQIYKRTDLHKNSKQRTDLQKDIFTQWQWQWQWQFTQEQIFTKTYLQKKTYLDNNIFTQRQIDTNTGSHKDRFIQRQTYTRADLHKDTFTKEPSIWPRCVCEHNKAYSCRIFSCLHSSVFWCKHN